MGRWTKWDANAMRKGSLLTLEDVELAQKLQERKNNSAKVGGNVGKVETIEQNFDKNCGNTQKFEQIKFKADDSRFLRGQVWLFEGEEAHKVYADGTKGRRPGLILSGNIGNNNNGNSVTLIPCTTNERCGNFATKIGWTNYKGIKQFFCCDGIVTVKKEQLTEYLSTVNEEIVKMVEKGVRIHLGFENVSEDEFYGRESVKIETIAKENGKVEQIDLFNAEFETIANEVKKVKEIEQIEGDLAKNRQDSEKVALFEKAEPEFGENCLTSENKSPMKIKIIKGDGIDTEFTEYNGLMADGTEESWDIETWKKNVKGKGNMKWTVAREVEFMKFCEKFGRKGTAELLGMTYSYVCLKVNEMKRKYKEFEPKHLACNRWSKIN